MNRWIVCTVSWLGSLACAWACAGCARETAAHPASSPTTAPAPASRSALGVTNAQPPSPESRGAAPAEPGKTAATDADGAVHLSSTANRTLPQPVPAAPGPRDRATRLVAMASEQIDQLLRLEGGEEEAQTAIRLDVAAALSDLENRRERILQDLRALELEPPTRSADLRMQLEEDDDQLKQSLDESYLVVPPPAPIDAAPGTEPER